MAGLIVIGYDGSADAKRAIENASALDAEHALVVNVWQPGLAAGTAALPLGAEPLPSPGDDEKLEAAARRTAEDGAARAGSIGLSAEPVVIRDGSAGDVGSILAQLAAERDAVAIVVGRRGMSRLEAAVLGSVSDATVRAAHCPVLVVPAPDDKSAS
jgi:nucleotide-binding universal stress UspA family protein